MQEKPVSCLLLGHRSLGSYSELLALPDWMWESIWNNLIFVLSKFWSPCGALGKGGLYKSPSSPAHEISLPSAKSNFKMFPYEEWLISTTNSEYLQFPRFMIWKLTHSEWPFRNSEKMTGAKDGEKKKKSSTPPHIHVSTTCIFSTGHSANWALNEDVKEETLLKASWRWKESGCEKRELGTSPPRVHGEHSRLGNWS